MSSTHPLRIGYFNQDFAPEVGAGPARILEFSRFWQEAGARVTVVTGMPNRRLPGLVDGAVHPDYRGRWFMEERWEGIRVLRSWVYAHPDRGFARTLVNNASYMATSALHALLRAGRFDVIIASSPPFLAHVSGESYRLLRRVPMVLEIRDLWPDYMVEMGVLRNRLAQRALFGLERYLLSRARRAVVVTESFRGRLARKGFDPARVDVIPNGVHLEQYYREPEAAPPLAELRRAPGETIVGYLGNFGAGQEIRTVVDAAQALRDVRGIRFVLAGDGKEKPLVEQHARELGVRNLSIHPPIPKEYTRAFYNACDICLAPLAPVSIFAETVPSKIFEVMACERPLIASVAGEAARIVEASTGGLVMPPGDAAAMARAILDLRGRSAVQLAEMGRQGREYVAGNYSRRALAERYLEMLHRVSGKTPASAQGSITVSRPRLPRAPAA